MLSSPLRPVCFGWRSTLCGQLTSSPVHFFTVPMPRPAANTPDLFPAPQPKAPLAEAMRPQRLEEVVGQTHLLGEGKPLTVAAQAGKLHSMILWGPPGVGKTTLARLMAQACDA